MAVTESYYYDVTRKLYFGTAAERAAMATGAIAIGSRYFESDTFLEYVWTGSWVKWSLHTVNES